FSITRNNLFILHSSFFRKIISFLIILYYNYLVKRNIGTKGDIFMVERLKRSEVPTEQTWDLTDLFPSHEEWEKELQAIQEDVHEVTQYKGKLGLDADTLLPCLTALDEFQKRVLRVATYANLRLIAYGCDTEDQRDGARGAVVVAHMSARLLIVV